MAAKVSHQDPTAFLWRLETRIGGMILLTGASGIWTMGSIETALANVAKFKAERRGGLAPQLLGSLLTCALRDASMIASPG